MDFFLLSLAVFRVSYLLVLEDGPFELTKKFRSLTATTPLIGAVLRCVYCTSLWVSLMAFPLAADISMGIFYWLGSSAIAIVLHEAIEALKSVGSTDAPD